MMFDAMLTSYPLVESGKARSLAVTTAARSSLTPRIPSVSELAMPTGYGVAIWHCIVLPAGAPKPIVERLNRESVKALASDEIKRQFAKYGAEPASSTPEWLGKYIASEISRWQKVAADAGMKSTE